MSLARLTKTTSIRSNKLRPFSSRRFDPPFQDGERKHYFIFYKKINCFRFSQRKKTSSFKAYPNNSRSSLSLVAVAVKSRQSRQSFVLVASSNESTSQGCPSFDDCIIATIYYITCFECHLAIKATQQ